jgi:hypothetical protein
MSAPETAKHSPAEHHDSHGDAESKKGQESPIQKDATKKVEDARHDAHGKVEATVGAHDLAHPKEPVVRHPQEPAWKPLPRPDFGALKKTALMTAAVVNPVATGTVAAGYLGWKGLAKFPPFRWIDQGVRKGLSTAKHVVTEGVSGVAKTLWYPFRLTGALAGNVLRVAGRTTYTVLDATVLELYRDMTKAINHKFGFVEGTNLLAGALIGIKAGLVALAKYPFRLVEKVAGELTAHPIRTTLAGIIAGAAIANPAAALAGVSQLFDAILKILVRLGQ